MGKIHKRKNFVKDEFTADGYNNLFAKLGSNTDNLSSYGGYTYGQMISRQRALLEIIYRTSWIAGQVVDTIAEDMTKEGIVLYSEMSPDNVQKMQTKITELEILKRISENIKWARLYGGSIAVILIDGQDYETPLNIKTIGKNKFKGLTVFDRWQVEPSLTDLITEVGPQMGLPKFYRVITASALAGQNIHYSRVIRLEGILMPYYQRMVDNYWGMSIIERLYDRLLAFDSATQGTAQMLYKAYLRVVKIKGLRTALAMGGKPESAVLKQFQHIRRMQSQEGITLLDGDDDFATHQYQFSGVSDVLIQFGQQISGATNIPLVRLFGQSPAGFSTGETDLRNYYDHIKKLQENELKIPILKLLEILCMSCFGEDLPEDFDFDFNPLWGMSEPEKSSVSSQDATSIGQAFSSGIITKKIAMKELHQLSKESGRFTNITNEDIENAKEEPPEHQGMGQERELPTEGKPDHKLDLSELENELNKLDKPEETMEDDLSSEASLEQLESELALLNGSSDMDLNKLEEELKALDPISLSTLEKELNAIIIGEKPASQLKENVKTLNLSDQTLKWLEEDLSNVKIISKRVNVTDRGSSFENAVRNTFGIKDASYAGNVGFEEMTKFYKVASQSDQNLMDQFANQGNWQNIKNLIRKVLGITLHDSITKDKEERWVTFKGKENSRKVKLDEHGKIIGGDLPKEAQGKKISSLKEVYKKKAKKKTSEPAKKLTNIEKKELAKKQGYLVTPSTKNHVHGKRNDKGEFVFANKMKMPEHLKGKSIPPAWKNILVNPDSKGKLWLTGFNEEGKASGWIYSDKHNLEKPLKKDSMVHVLNKNIKVIDKQLDKGMNSKDQNEKEIAVIAKILALSGARIGSSKEALGKVKTYGASTLQGEHIIPQKDGTVILDFIGKSKQQNICEIKDKKTAQILLALKKKAGKGKPVFNIPYVKVLNHVKELDGGGFTPKNFRTKIGTDIAIEEVKKRKAPTNPKEYKKALKEISIIVAKRLNNTPGVTLKDYIVPSVWTEWKRKAGVE